MKNKSVNKTRRLKQTSIKLPEFLSSVKPGNDFYKYVNGNWLDQTSIPLFRSSFGVSEEIELTIETQLESILAKSYSLAEKGTKPSTKREKMMDVIGRFMLSALRASKQKKNVEFLRMSLQKMICIRDTRDIVNIIGSFNRHGIPTFLNLNIFQKRTPTNEYTIMIDKGTVGLPDVSYYKATAPGKSHTLFAYVKLCEEVAKLLNINDIRGTVHMEAELSTMMDKYNDEKYQDIEGDKLQSQFLTIPWEEMFRSYGLEDASWKKKSIRVYNVKWLEYLEKIFKTWPMDVWSGLFTLHMILYSLPILPSPYDTLHFEFFGRRLRGQKQKLPQDQLTLNLCRALLRIPLSYLYIEDYIDVDLKKDVTKMVESIQNHTVKIIDTLDWLEPATRKIAIDKIRKMNLGISHSNLLDIEIPNLITDSFLQNMFLLGEMNTSMMISQLNKKATDVWNEPPYTVNAYYFSEQNQFILPAGAIKWPFYRKSKSNGWNYGGLGAIIGHEITHAFDIDGKEYTAEGKRESWWTQKDNYQYKKRTDSLVNLFNKAKILGHSVDGLLTLSENLADLGGLAIALDALLSELNDVSEEEKKKELRDFFVSYAVSWRVKERNQKQLQSLFLDVHSPAELRVNYIVSQFDIWYELFDVVTGDDLYVAPEDRIKIF
jgi:predicted metalloendopeptidase